MKNYVPRTADVAGVLIDAGFRSHRAPDPTGKHRFRRRAGFQCFQDGDRVLVYQRTRSGRYANAVRQLRKYQRALDAEGFTTALVTQCVVVTSQ